MKWLVAVLALQLSHPAMALQAKDLIQEAEEVYNQLPAHAPEKRAVALRLADLLFDAAIEVDSDAKATAADNQRADGYRAQSERLYKDVLPKLNPAQTQRVRFQLARLYSFKAQMPQAIALWKEIFETPGHPRLKREAALHWAEQLELANDNSSIQQAADLYSKALPLADQDMLRSYILYRSSWTHYRMGQAAKAVELLEKSIALAVDKERDDLFRDMVLFMSRDEKAVKPQLAAIEKLQATYKRTGYVQQLADAYLAADRKGDYAFILGYLNETDPNLERAVSILDAAHDGLSMDGVLAQLEEINRLRRAGVKFKNADIEKKSKDKLFRLVHLWDGNRRAKKAGADKLLVGGVSTMILLFPTAEETSQAISGWLAAHTDPKVQRPQVDTWIAIAQEVKHTPLEVRLTQNKLELARQSKDWNVVVETSRKLELITAANARPVRYQRAKALYELKNYEEALPVFLALAQEKSDGKDEFKKLSQDLALDILAIQKRFEDIAIYTGKWKGEGGERGEELAAIGEKSKFEGAAAAQDANSLAVFTQFCLEKKFTPKSCDNARSLAGKLRNQGTLITVLKAQGDEKELTRQLEVAGRFGESARMIEKTLKPEERMMWLKVALLYELQGELKERDRVLTKFSQIIAKQKMTDEEQALIFATLNDAGLVNEKTLALPWSEAFKAKIASDLYDKSPTPGTQAILAKYCGPAGNGWQKVHLKAMKETNDKQAKIQFTGAKSKRQFEDRVALLKTLGNQANCFKQGATSDLAKNSATKVSEAYSEFAKAILATPMPEGLDEETEAEVKAQIETMASPFQKQSENWLETAAQITDAPEMPVAWNFDAPVEDKDSSNRVVFDWQPYLNDIQKEPFVKAHFEQLRTHFENKGRGRLAAYVKGRLQDMEVAQ